MARATLGPAASWDDQTELLAATVDRLGLVEYLLRRAHFKGDPDPPRPVPRPGEDPDGAAALVDPVADDNWMPSSPAEALALLRAELD